MANIPKYVEYLEIGKAELTQEMLNSLREINSLKDLILLETKISVELNFSIFENFKKIFFLGNIF